MWLQMGKLYGASVQAIYLDADSDFCLKRISNRKDHPTINPEKMSMDKMRSIIRGFANEFVQPDLSEGFDSILFIRVKC
jgi:thymidylate kinase